MDGRCTLGSAIDFSKCAARGHDKLNGVPNDDGVVFEVPADRREYSLKQDAVSEAVRNGVRSQDWSCLDCTHSGIIRCYVRRQVL